MSYVKTINDFVAFDWSSYTSVGPQGDLFKDYLVSLNPHFLNVLVPLLSVAGYWFLSEPIFKRVRKIVYPVEPKKGDDVKPTSQQTQYNSFIRLITILHSLALTVYSGWTCINIASIIVQYWLELSAGGLSPWNVFMTMSCDADGTLWQTKGVGFWVSHFYLSKYWEFLDTWLLHLSGKEPMLLQTYHHAGVVILMWAFVVSRNTSSGMIITVLNSGIHTIMYAYYTLTALKISAYENLADKTKKYWASWITKSQLAQFVAGIVLTLPTYFYYDAAGCEHPARQLGTVGIHVYVIILMKMFLDFYNKKYTKDAAASALAKPKSN